VWTWVSKNTLRLVYGSPKERFAPEGFKEGEHGDVEVIEEEGKFLLKVGGRTLQEDISITRDGEYFCLTMKMWRGNIFGLGDKMGPMNRKQRKYIFFNADDPIHTPTADPLYKSIPFFIVLDRKTSFGVFFNYPGYMEMDFDSEGKGVFKVKVRGEGLVEYFIFNSSVKEVVREFLNLTGKNFPAPIWAFGYHQSRWGYTDRNVVMEIARKFREKGIPCDGIFLDLEHMDSFKNFTWDEENFKEFPEFVKELHDMGFKVVPIVDAGVKVEEGYKIFDEGEKNGYFLKTKDGKDFEGAVWPGRTRFPDFTRDDVREWWGEKYANFVKKTNVDGFWNDMNEPTIFATQEELDEMRERMAGINLDDGWMIPLTLLSFSNVFKSQREEEIVHKDDLQHWEVRNAYGMLMTKACWEGLKKRFPDRRFLILSRSAYPGIQRYGGVWTGDNHSWWEHILQEMINIQSLSICGIFFCGFDVGGFGGDVTPELLVRFYQLGAFTPFFRNHSAIGTKRQEPWVFGEYYENVIKETINLRYSLIPYIYSSYMLGIMKNEPLVRPLFFEFQDDPVTHTIEDEYMFGPSILVAPIYRFGQEKRVVYLPKVRWLYIPTGEIMEPGWRVVDAPLEVIPLFQREDTAVVRTDPQNFIFEEDLKRLYFDVFLNERVEIELYEDDGESLSFEKGDFSLRKVLITKDKIEVESSRGGYKPPVREWVFKILEVEGRVKEISILVGERDLKIPLR